MKETTLDTGDRVSWKTLVRASAVKRRTRLFLLATVAGVAFGCSSASPERSASDESKLSAPGTRIVGLGGKCVDVDGGQIADGTKVQLWTCNGSDAQRWTLANGTLVGPGGNCLNVRSGGNDDGTIVELHHCNGTGAQS